MSAHYFLTFGIGLVLCVIFTPILMRISIQTGRMAQPRFDRWHKKPTALFGGIGIFSAFCLSLIIGFGINIYLAQLPWGIMIGSFVIFILGLYDDFKSISPQAKIIIQIIASTIVISLGYTSDFFSPRLTNPVLAQTLNILFTYLWILGITNAINLLDNMDGLAAGISFIAACILSFFFWRIGDLSLLYVSMALAGSVLGFLIFNLPPASIFMGDSGSLFLGFTLATLAIARQPQASNVFAVLGIPTLIFLLPIFDTILVTITRLMRGKSPLEGGLDHSSHRLITFGLTERQTVFILFSVALGVGIFAASLESINYWVSLVVVPIVIISVALITAYLGGLKIEPFQKDIDHNNTLTQIILELTFRHRILEILLDFFLIGIAFYLAILIEFNFAMNQERLLLFLQTLPVALGVTYISFYFFGIYRVIWRYVDFDDIFRLFKAALGSVLLFAFVILIIRNIGDIEVFVDFPQVIFIFFAVFLFLGLAASRSTFRVMDLIKGQQPRPPEQQVLIVGAGDYGEMALRWIFMNPEIQYKPVGFLDENPYLLGKRIHGIEVVGSLKDLNSYINKNQIDGVIVTTGFGDSTDYSEISAICNSKRCWVRILKIDFEKFKE